MKLYVLIDDDNGILGIYTNMRKAYDKLIEKRDRIRRELKWGVLQSVKSFRQFVECLTLSGNVTVILTFINDGGNDEYYYIQVNENYTEK